MFSCYHAVFFGEYLSGPHRPDVASVRRIVLRNQVFKHRRSLIDQESSHTPNKKEILVTTRSVKFNRCVYFGSGVLSRNSAGNKLFLGTTEVLKVSLTVLFTCAQQKASGHCCAQGCFHHSEVHTDPPRRNYQIDGFERYLQECLLQCYIRTHAIFSYICTLSLMQGYDF